MTNTATIALTNAHGLFEVPVRTLNRALAATAHRSDLLIRQQAASHCGFGEFDIKDHHLNPLSDCTRMELLIIWIESGNHTF